MDYQPTDDLTPEQAEDRLRELLLDPDLGQFNVRSLRLTETVPPPRLWLEIVRDLSQQTPDSEIVSFCGALRNYLESARAYLAVDENADDVPISLSVRLRIDTARLQFALAERTDSQDVDGLLRGIQRDYRDHTDSIAAKYMGSTGA